MDDDVPDLRHGNGVVRRGLAAARRLGAQGEGVLGFLLAIAVGVVTMVGAIALLDDNGLLLGPLAAVAELMVALAWSWPRRRGLARGILAATVVLGALVIIAVVVVLGGGLGIAHD